MMLYVKKNVDNINNKVQKICKILILQCGQLQ